MREDSVDLETTLDRLIGRLTRAGAAKGAKALLVDARRLRTVVGNWQTIQPTDEAQKEMTARVLQLARLVDSAAPPGRDSAAPPERQLYERQPAVAARSAPPFTEELTRAAPFATQLHVQEERAAARIDVAGEAPPARHRTLPDLDISGIAELVDEGPAPNFDKTFDTGLIPIRGRRAEVDPYHPRPPSEPAARDRQSSSYPPNGRRRADPLAHEPERPARAASRSSYYLVDPDTDGDGGAPYGPVYPASLVENTPAPAPVPAPARSQPRASVVPAVAPALPEGKTPIAVRPLPAPETLDPRLIMLTEPYSPRADAYRALRRKLSGPGSPRTIAVTSAEPGEGKTSCAVNMALAFRETSNEKVLLIEANLRAPSLAALFGFEPPMCFARQMAKNRDSTRASWTVVEQFEPLHVLAVDPAAKNPPLLDPVAFANALEQLIDAGYDHIIVDTPPALGGSDVNLVADAVDGVVVVASIKKSKKSLVKKAIDQLKPATILGVVTLDG